MKMQPELCQVEDALGILVGKWKPIILLILLQDGTHRFSELKRRVPGITQKMLTIQLRELEGEDLITRKVYPQVPPYWMVPVQRKTNNSYNCTKNQ